MFDYLFTAIFFTIYLVLLVIAYRTAKQENEYFD